MRNLRKKILALICINVFSVTAAIAAEDHLPPKEIQWPFDGPFGTFDRQAAQRGLQVYKEVCSACHSLKRIAFRNLLDLGYSEEEIKSLAASYQILDGPDDQGEMFHRPGKPSDYFPSPFANDNAARASNNGALPPDFSLLVKARHDGPNYIHSLITGFEATPAGFDILPTQYYNPYFPGRKLSMPPPLTQDGQVKYEDGTNPTIDQMSRDVVQFMQWAAEPEMEQRKRMGISAIIYIALFTIIFFFAYKKIWKRVK
jgi:ubiquinol-cytochrome c reductase cytochrome c1 subunit